MRAHKGKLFFSGIFVLQRVLKYFTRHYFRAVDNLEEARKLLELGFECVWLGL